MAITICAAVTLWTCFLQIGVTAVVSASPRLSILSLLILFAAGAILPARVPDPDSVSAPAV
ncbi:hypothetical protein RM530_06265 [Algiphilus sp. W345]|uniref:Uncharacterized protein n=1 Tax=Banduia mediterranea TaxID=3075609 RepID=A0ABU2WGH0_9GAMM|nr:hypothetical protein [Algiphilus sp. W345]MDT0496970.1 hypothetical protein [Algiphilus sp. W345]